MNNHVFPLMLIAPLLWHSVAQAQSDDSAMAQSLFDQAKTLMAEGHVPEACPKLEESQRLDPRSGTLINLASCYEQTGQLASAWARYLEAATSARASGNADREAVARERASALAPRVSKIVIVVPLALSDVAGLEITRDGTVAGKPAWGTALPSDPGEHQVVAKAPGFEPFETKVTVVGEGQTISVDVPQLAALRPQPSDHATREVGTGSVTLPLADDSGLGAVRTVAVVATGLGVVGLGFGTVFLVQKNRKVSERDGICTECTQDQLDRQRVLTGQARTANTLSTVGYAVGGSLVVGGAAAILLASARKHRVESAWVLPMITPSAVGFSGEMTW